MEEKIVGWNTGAENMFGWKEEEALGREAGLFFTEEDRVGNIPQIELGKARETSKAMDERGHGRKDGSRIWVSGFVTPWIRNGEHLGYSKVARDITDRKRAHSIIEEPDHHFRLILDSLTEHAIIPFDVKGRIESWNLSAQRNFLYSPQEAIGQPISLIFTEEDIRLIRSGMKTEI